ncbi:MAG: hypothetical protein ACLT3H_03895 [Roseburia sp.]
MDMWNESGAVRPEIENAGNKKAVANCGSLFGESTLLIKKYAADATYLSGWAVIANSSSP